MTSLLKMLNLSSINFISFFNSELVKIYLILLFASIVTIGCFSIFKNNLDKDVLIKDLIRKIGNIIIIVVALAIDNIFDGNYISNLVIGLFISREILAIIKFWRLMGLPIPKKVYIALNDYLVNKKDYAVTDFLEEELNKYIDINDPNLNTEEKEGEILE